MLAAPGMRHDVLHHSGATRCTLIVPGSAQFNLRLKTEHEHWAEPGLHYIIITRRSTPGSWILDPDMYLA